MDDSKVTIRIENTYACGRESVALELVEGPDDNDMDGDMGQWWEDVVYPLTGDGHPCGSTEHAMHNVTIVEAPDFPELVGEINGWEG